jgi:hypothetical protein
MLLLHPSLEAPKVVPVHNRQATKYLITHSETSRFDCFKIHEDIKYLASTARITNVKHLHITAAILSVIKSVVFTMFCFSWM